MKNIAAIYHTMAHFIKLPSGRITIEPCVEQIIQLRDIYSQHLIDAGFQRIQDGTFIFNYDPFFICAYYIIAATVLYQYCLLDLRCFVLIAIILFVLFIKLYEKYIIARQLHCAQQHMKEHNCINIFNGYTIVFLQTCPEHLLREDCAFSQWIVAIPIE